MLKREEEAILELSVLHFRDPSLVGGLGFQEPTNPVAKKVARKAFLIHTAGHVFCFSAAAHS